ncbi:PepSY-associated TM helix domain-containing protein [Streptomyces sp. NPDC057257]|uniref:PepSY-associated TM helix domain-containing protein n=1 Tax=Streptomyces sp. NPDC057257 TaxID=3346071 RepID=UPI00363ADD36
MSVDSEVPDLPQPEPATSTVPSPAAKEPGAGPGRRPQGLGPLLTRLHFYAGVLVAPFLLVAAVTGLLYAFTPQLDSLVYGKELTVAHTGGSTRPLSEQVAAARAEHPTGTLTAVRPGSGDHTTQVDFSLPSLGDNAHTVYVDPYTGKVRGQLTTYYTSTPLTTWLDVLHRDLHLGTVGNLYSEIAASWLWVLVLGGLVLWWGRRRGTRTARRLLLPDRTAKKGGVRRTRSRHAVTGVWIALGLLFLSATGLTWSTYAGAHFSKALHSMSSSTPYVSTSLAGASSGTTSGTPKRTDPSDIDGVLRSARDYGLDGPVQIGVPENGATAWTVSQTRNLWPVGRDSVAVDASTDTVVHHVDFADWPFLAKLTTWGIQAHMGLLFGLANQLVLAALAIGLISVIVLGYRMWWQRRPTRADRRASFGAPPARGAWRGMPSSTLAVGIVLVAAIGWAIPLFGIPLALFLVADIVIGAVRRRRTTPPAPNPTTSDG